MAATVEDLKSWTQEHLNWFGQSAFRITTAGSRIFIDPFRVPSSAGPATLVLVTHPHQDHYDRQAIEGLRGAETVVVLPMSCAGPGQRGFAPGQTERIGAVKITGLPSYNVAKRFHPRSGSWLGYVVEVDGVRVYHAGDTDPLPGDGGSSPRHSASARGRDVHHELESSRGRCVEGWALRSPSQCTSTRLLAAEGPGIALRLPSDLAPWSCAGKKGERQGSSSGRHRLSPSRPPERSGHEPGSILPWRPVFQRDTSASWKRAGPLPAGRWC